MNLSKSIKTILITMAIKNQIPSDMNELDESVFDNLIDDNMIERAAEEHALGQILSEIPDMSYDDILYSIIDETTLEYGIIVWQPFEADNPERICQLIENAKDSAVSLIKNILK